MGCAGVEGLLGTLCRQRPPFAPQIKFGATDLGAQVWRVGEWSGGGDSGQIPARG